MKIQSLFGTDTPQFHQIQLEAHRKKYLEESFDDLSVLFSSILASPRMLMLGFCTKFSNVSLCMFPLFIVWPMLSFSTLPSVRPLSFVLSMSFSWSGIFPLSGLVLSNTWSSHAFVSFSVWGVLFFVRNFVIYIQFVCIFMH